MKKKVISVCLACIVAGLAGVLLSGSNKRTTKAAPKKSMVVGTFDSRAIALADFDKFRKEGGLKKLFNDHKKAKDKGDSKRAEELEAKGAALQKKLHMRVFGNAPIDDILKKIEKDIPKIAASNGVDIVVNKWDVIYKNPSAKCMDLTGPMVNLFDPDKEMLKRIKELLKHQPVPREKLEKIDSSDK